MWSSIARLKQRAFSYTHYPIVRKIINATSTDTTIETEDSTQIGASCLLRGTIRLGEQVDVSSRVGHTELSGDISVCKGTSLNGHNTVSGVVDIGRYCDIAPYVSIRSDNHATTFPSINFDLYTDVLDSAPPTESSGAIEIGHDVWVGDKATILSGVTVGNGAVIGANAVITDDVEPYSIVAGVPAEKIGERLPENIQNDLLEMEWWNWSEDEMRRNQEFFQSKLPNKAAINSEKTDR